MSSLNPPKTSEQLIVSFPAEHVLLLTFNRPRQLNAMTPQMDEDLRRVLNWFEEEPSLWVVIVTGAGRLFCAGADLKAWNNDQQSGTVDEQERVLNNPYGFGSISRRQSKKPFIAAVNGGAYGGGMEMILNCDYVIAAENAKFALPEVKRGVIAIQGGIPRLTQIAGHQLASELLLLGKTISAPEAQGRFGFVNQVVPASELLPAAVAVAKQILENSPDAVQATKRALLLSQEFGHSVMLPHHVLGPESKATYTGQNIKEGLKAFSEKRAPQWKNPAKL
ncbi:enoyl-CoA hydratase/carnithine racemase [Coprinopsis cinerea okayama7|uniref:Enoyl-CoA hydratase/carnithine racemase n=1 Tax=Coprinopsis cinerea (strain Okayama-7 / 130 / ATCC MYA-4618 / FGSC 9003) TaxID=240176 RepID=A8N3H3_COPC7|nr:enoyl-CoA hydratase/carnithine racemase [Coprinopsis cinerea okayama7\|eukprot:XP_001829550.1 enoyl-CoA hydratase/carnithine racemase [Coprinopsis cinerea okayama7\